MGPWHNMALATKSPCSHRAVASMGPSDIKGTNDRARTCTNQPLNLRQKLRAHCVVLGALERQRVSEPDPARFVPEVTPQVTITSGGGGK